MPKRADDKPISLYPMTFEELIRRAVSTPPLNPSRRGLKRKRAKRRTRITSK